ncbi:hypothetical protein F3Y22_tig00110258pilonHSYRG00127 [Hibiscus syriacus]|uniref:Agglutinin domain-containing protein n=1 Tax=Hibiscus syriacus TaxID=106335 RepID=A0A6A3BBX8_HIBSY|nr:uncharacterized protein LOC120115181 [Hibiscus syriacus]KAE8712299.1 hypothetical protein F3Y22_tig00110258pilonHSYRG00127 [Hibiscus syriacus]
MELAPRMSFPRFIVLEARDKLNYMSYTRGGDTDGYLRFFEDRIQNPFAKFEVEFSTNNRALAHIRSCQNNKYWERTKNLSLTGSTSSQYWITATAGKKEEDQSKESCTLFRIISVNAAQNWVRIQHVQSGCYLCLWRWNNPRHTRSVLANYRVFDGQSADIFTIIDWKSLLFLPRYLAFKGDNEQYLCVRYLNKGRYPFLQFITDDIGDPTVPCEVFPTNDGSIRFKQISNQNYWRRSPNWIWADSNDTSTNNRDTLFRPVKVDEQTIGLINLGNNRFCKRLTAENNTSCLNAAVTTLTREAQLKVEEAVLTRQIYGVRYNLDNARVYDEQLLSLDENTSINGTQEPSTLDVTLSYTETRTSSWNTTISLKLGVTSTMEFKLPLIFEGKIELSSEFQSSIKWGNTAEATTLVEVVNKVTVPPMTKATVSAWATNGKCDVPFTYLQRDTLFDGTTVLSEVQGGVFTGSNYYNINFVTKNEKLRQ